MSVDLVSRRKVSVDMMTPAQPNWDLVHDPVAFFGLPEDYDRSQLKRAYKTLILRYRPDKSPAEFERIRKAYEILERGHRYGIDLPPAAYQLERHREMAREAKSESPSITLLEQLQNGLTPREAYDRLRCQSHHSPSEYYQLALLADLASEAEPELFARWLVRGIRQHPHDPMLRRLLYEYCNHPNERAQAQQLVGILAEETLDFQTYAWVTEPLWQRLAQELDVVEFEQLFERMLDQSSLGYPRAAVHLRTAVLRAHILRGSEKWVTRHYHWVQENFFHASSALEEDLHIIDLLFDYRKVRSEYLNGPPPNREVDELILLWTGADRYQIDFEFLRWQAATRQDPDRLFAAYDLEQPTHHASAMELLRYLIVEVRSRIPYARPAGDMIGITTQSLARDMNQRCTKAFSYYSITELKNLAAQGSSFIILIALWIIPTFVLESAQTKTLWIIAGLATLLWLLVVRPLVENITLRQVEKFKKRSYQKVYRPEVARLITQTHYPLPAIVECLAHYTENKTLQEMAMLLEHDQALELYSLAHS